MVFEIFKAEPHPVSQSTKIGRLLIPLILLKSSKTLSNEVRAKSGKPNEAFATPAPDIYKAFMPVFLASKAEYGLIAPATESGFSFFKTSKKEILTRCAPLKFSSIHCEKML